jgi:hypothetical protein
MRPIFQHVMWCIWSSLPCGFGKSDAFYRFWIGWQGYWRFCKKIQGWFCNEARNLKVVNNGKITHIFHPKLNLLTSKILVLIIFFIFFNSRFICTPYNFHLLFWSCKLHLVQYNNLKPKKKYTQWIGLFLFFLLICNLSNKAKLRLTRLVYEMGWI